MQCCFVFSQPNIVPTVAFLLTETESNSNMDPLQQMLLWTTYTCFVPRTPHTKVATHNNYGIYLNTQHPEQATRPTFKK